MHEIMDTNSLYYIALSNRESQLSKQPIWILEGMIISNLKPFSNISEECPTCLFGKFKHLHILEKL